MVNEFLKLEYHFRFSLNNVRLCKVRCIHCQICELFDFGSLFFLFPAVLKSEIILLLVREPIIRSYNKNITRCV